MDIHEILDVEGRTAEDIIADLRKKTIDLPDWAKLEREYDRKKHPVFTDRDYKDKTKNGKTEKVARIGLSWQKLAVRRMSELIFGIPVNPVFSPEDENETRAANIIKDVLRRNRYDSMNLERSKYLYASCEIATIWFTQEAPAIYAGEESQYKIRCKTFSPKKGDKLWPLFDEYDDLIALSVEYAKNEDGNRVTYFETYTEDRHLRWKITDKYELELDEEVTTGKICGVYVKRDTPIWEDESDLVYEAEWTLSRNSNYIKKNARPTGVLKSDSPVKVGNENTGNEQARNVIRVPANGDFHYAEWAQAIESIKFHVQMMKQQYDTALQLPDMSSDNMKESPMSGESRKMLFIDAQMKVLDEQGIWLEALDREINVLRAMCKELYPQLRESFDAVKVDIVITPFEIRDNAELINTLSTAVSSKIMSKRTAVANLGYAPDVDAELEEIDNDGANDLFSDMSEPTM